VSDEDKFWPLSNFNGARVAFEARARNESSIWLFARDQKPRKLCAGCSHPTSWFTADQGVFHATSKGEIALLDVESMVSKPVLSSQSGVMLSGADWNPGHGYLLFTASENGGMKRLYTVRLSRAAQATGSWIAITNGIESVDLPHWSADGKSIFYLSKRDGYACIWSQRFDPILGEPSGKPKPIAHYHDPRATPERAGPLVRGLSVADEAIFLNVGEITETILSGVLTSPPVWPFLRRLFPN
jgi:WD40 repeat protein